MQLENLYYFLLGLFNSVDDTEHLNYDLCTYHLIDFSKRFLALGEQQRCAEWQRQQFPTYLSDPRFLKKLEDASKNNPDKFDLNWFHYYFKNQIDNI